jgi:hypothetical protein
MGDYVLFRIGTEFLKSYVITKRLEITGRLAF